MVLIQVYVLNKIQKMMVKQEISGPCRTKLDLHTNIEKKKLFLTETRHFRFSILLYPQ